MQEKFSKNNSKQISALFNLAFKIIFIFCFSILFFLSCSTQNKKELLKFSDIETFKQNFEWKNLEEGIWISDLFYKKYPLILHAVKIDLSNSKLKIIDTEEKLFHKKSGTVKMETSLNFAKRNNTIIASCAGFFYAKSYIFSRKAKVLGLHISDGKILNPEHKNFGTIYFFKNNSAIILDAGEKLNGTQKYQLEDVNVAVSGRKMILKNGKAIITNLHKKEDSRTCIGLSADKKTLYLLFIEAENKKKSRGTTYDQSAFFMKKLGAADAIQMDGGGSSSLIIKQNGKQKIISPSISPFGLRRVATNLGFIILK